MIAMFCAFFPGANNSVNVFNIWPLYGPVAGGTIVTVTGEGLNTSDAVVALFPADFRYDVIHLYSLSGSRLADGFYGADNRGYTSIHPCLFSRNSL